MGSSIKIEYNQYKRAMSNGSLMQEANADFPNDTMTNPQYTYSLNKVSCIRDAWFVHVTFAFLVVLSGIGCLMTRIVYKKLHVYFGRLYIICMLWCMGTSLVIHNTGLPIAVLTSFVWVLGGLTAGWILIKLHQLGMEKKASIC